MNSALRRVFTPLDFSGFYRAPPVHVCRVTRIWEGRREIGAKPVDLICRTLDVTLGGNPCRHRENPKLGRERPESDVRFKHVDLLAMREQC